MSDDATKGPTPAQLAAAGLIAVTTYEEIEAAYANGQGPLRSYNAATEKFPPVTSGYVAKPKPVDVTITFNSEGGSAVNSITIPVGTSIEEPASTRSGYTFDGWFTAPTDGSAILFPYVASGSGTIYAQWTAVSPAPSTGLPPLGANLQQATYWATNGPDPVGISVAKNIGMKYIRDQLPWNFQLAGGGTGPMNPKPGVYQNLNIAQETVASIRAAGMEPIFQVTIGGKFAGANSGMCEVLGTALTVGETYTSISVNPEPDYEWGQLPGIPFPISVGDTIQLINPNDQSQTQTVVATEAMAQFATGPLSVKSFVAASSFPVGTWIYDEAWAPCTPQHLATFLTWLVSQPGMQGLRICPFNEPDGGSWPVRPSLLVQVHKLAYGPMKKADPTCIVHAFGLQNFDLQFTATPFYNFCIANGITGFFDVYEGHLYSWASTDTPDSTDGFGYSLSQLVAQFQKNRLAKGDKTPMMVTEGGAQCSGTGLSPTFQAAWFETLLTELAGHDNVNNVPFASYLIGFIMYWITNSTDPYSITPPPARTSPAVTTLTQLGAS